MSPDMIVGIAIGAAGMGLLIAALYLWMPRKVERLADGIVIVPETWRPDPSMPPIKPSQASSPLITRKHVAVSVEGWPEHLSEKTRESLREQLRAMAELSDRTGAR